MFCKALFNKFDSNEPPDEEIVNSACAFAVQACLVIDVQNYTQYLTKQIITNNYHNLIHDKIFPEKDIKFDGILGHIIYKPSDLKITSIELF